MLISFVFTDFSEWMICCRSSTAFVDWNYCLNCVLLQSMMQHHRTWHLAPRQCKHANSWMGFQIASHLGEVWGLGLAQRLAREEQRSLVNTNFAALNPAQQKVFESCIDKRVVADIIVRGLLPVQRLFHARCKRQVNVHEARLLRIEPVCSSHPTLFSPVRIPEKS